MRRSVRSCTNGGVSDKKTTTVKATIKGKSIKTPKTTKRRSNKFNYTDTDDDADEFLQLNKNNNNTVITDNLNYKMPVYNIIARRHKV